MKKDPVNILNNKSGMVVIEATIVFPIMFFCLLFIIFMGNAHYEKAKVDAAVMSAALQGAQILSDPFYDKTNTAAENPDLFPTAYEDLGRPKPYRYILGFGNIDSEIEKSLYDQIDRESFSFFKTMRIRDLRIEASHNNYLVYSTFSVEADYIIRFPLTFTPFADSPRPLLRITSRAEVPVKDSVEFIRNTDMAVDYLAKTRLGKSVSNMFQKVGDVLNRIESFPY